MKSLNLFIFVGLLLALHRPLAARADTMIGENRKFDFSAGISSHGFPAASLKVSEGLTRIFGADGRTDFVIGVSEIEYFGLNVRLLLVDQSPEGTNDNNQNIKVFLVLPIIGKIRMRPGYNDPRADEVSSNVSMDASYGGLGFQIARDVTKYVRVAARTTIAHHASSEMLPSGTYTTDGAIIMDRRNSDGSLVTNVIDASGAEIELKVQARVFNKLLISLRGAAARVQQNSHKYKDLETQAGVQYAIGHLGSASVGAYGDYYWRLTDLTDLGKDRSFHLLTGGVNLNW